MTTTIAHISDIHQNRIDVAVSDRLRRALRDAAPKFLVVSGDFADNPWQLGAAKKWVIETCSEIGIDPAKGLLVVPGNHDFRFAGNFGFKPLTQYWFRKYFGEYCHPVRFVSESNITFISLDSNPVCFGFARGYIGSGQLRRIQKALEEDHHRQSIAKSLKIAILHHHAVPVPYQKGWEDEFLVLENVNRLLQFLADNNVTLVLHGHNHMAPLSMLSLGTLQGQAQVIDVLGAGTAIAGGKDHENRGHNFNVVTAEDCGLIYVRQFFATPGHDFSEAPHPSVYQQSFDSVFLRNAANVGYS